MPWADFSWLTTLLAAVSTCSDPTLHYRTHALRGWEILELYFLQPNVFPGIQQHSSRYWANFSFQNTSRAWIFLEKLGYCLRHFLLNKGWVGLALAPPWDLFKSGVSRSKFLTIRHTKMELSYRAVSRANVFRSLHKWAQKEPQSFSEAGKRTFSLTLHILPVCHKYSSSWF